MYFVSVHINSPIHPNQQYYVRMVLYILRTGFLTCIIFCGPTAPIGYRLGLALKETERDPATVSIHVGVHVCVQNTFISVGTLLSCD